MRWATRTMYLAILLVLVAFPYGPLFPWSPMTPGYDRVRLKRADILYPRGAAIDADYHELDRYIEEAERFHALKMPKRVTVVACRDWDDFQRFMPNMRSHGVGAVTLATGTVVYVTPRVGEQKFSTGEFLRHELSHAALNQNQSLLNAYRIGKEQWFAEGLAVLFGRQRAYISAAEFIERARTRELWPLFDGSAQSDMRFAYQAWRYFLDHLIATRGRERFVQLERGCIDAPPGCRAAFQSVYAVSLQTAVERFQDDLRGSRWSPAESEQASINPAFGR